MSNKDLHQHSKISHHLLEKLSSRITAIKEDLTEAVKERSRSFSADRHHLVSSTNSLPTTNPVTFSLQDDYQILTMPTQQLFTTSGENLLEKCVILINRCRRRSEGDSCMFN